MPVSWRQQMAPGRVFEMRTKSQRYKPVCGLILGPHGRDAWDVIQVFEGSGVLRSYQPTDVKRTFLHTWYQHDLTSSRIARRRPDLERFDSDDLSFIKYGRDLEFGGRSWGGHVKDHIPSIEADWTIFWTKHANWHVDRRNNVATQLLNGAWWLESWCGGDWTFGRASRLCGWATRHSDPRRLSQIEHVLRIQHGHLERSAVRVRELFDGKCYHTVTSGNAGPAFHAPGRWSSTKSLSHHLSLAA